MSDTSISLEGLSTEEILAELEKRKANEKLAESQKRKDFLAEKDLFIQSTVAGFSEISAELKNLKYITITRANELYEKMFQLFDKEPKKQNQFTLKSEDGQYRVTVDRQERFEFNEEATVHIESIKDIFKAKFADVDQNLYNLMDSLLMKNNKGDYDPKLLSKVRQKVEALGDAELITSFDNLVKCQQVVGSSLYCRAYKIDDQGKWQDINVQFSSL